MVIRSPRNSEKHVALASVLLGSLALLSVACHRKKQDSQARSGAGSQDANALWQARIDTLRNEAQKSASSGIARLADALSAAQKNADSVSQSDPVDALYAGLVTLNSDFRRNTVLVFESRSPLPATPQSPRIIVWSEAEGLVVSSAGTGADVEILEYDEAKAALRFHKIDLPLVDSSAPRTPGGQNLVVAEVSADEASCKKCHGQTGRPVWDAATGWPGVYGSLPSDGRILQSPDKRDTPDALGNFQAQTSHPVLKRKEWEALNAFVWTHEGGYKARPRYRHIQVGEAAGAANVAYITLVNNNFELGDTLSRLQGRAVLAALEASAQKQNDATPEELGSAFLFLAKLVPTPQGAGTAADYELRPNPLGEAFERAYENDPATKARADELRKDALSIQTRYANDIFARQEKIFSRTFGVDFASGQTPATNTLFRPLEKDGPTPVTERAVKLLTFLQSRGIEPRLLSTNAFTLEKKDKEPLVTPDGGGIFHIGSMGDVFMATCAAFAQKYKGTARCTLAREPRAP